ncbi:MAG: class IV adenylate cyclase [Acidobacteriota bacterium]
MSNLDRENLELKAYARDLGESRRRLVAAAIPRLGLEHQRDYYLVVGEQRVKIRIIDDTHAFLIPYQRANTRNAKASRYRLQELSCTEALATVANAEVLTTVIKQREIFLYAGNTRIHLDQVEGLGEFIEFEYLIRYGDEAEWLQAHKTLEYLTELLAIAPQDCLAGSYSDLL